jgi:hypothetical protein
MTRKLRKTTPEDLALIDMALIGLTSARINLKAAGCSQAIKYVRACLKSVEGAKRHALRALPPEERPPTVINLR